MQNSKKKKMWGRWLTAAIVIWLVMNIRVALGVSSTFERAVDGLVGVGLLVAVVFLALDFFNVIRKVQE